MNANEMWQTVLGEIELQISRPNFLTWLRQSKLLGKDEREGVALVSLPSSFAKDWVMGRYHKLILGSLRNIDSSIKNIDYIVTDQDGDALSVAQKAQRKQKSNYEIKPQEPLIELRVDPATNLNPRYNLGSFVVGSSNELAYAAVQAVVDDVGRKYNPLFIYGGVGLGKTHLIQGAGNAIREKYSHHIKVMYVMSEKFINDVVWAIRNKRMEDMKKKYRDCDVLIVDDIQFIGGKTATELEFFYTFNALHEHSKQIIISSDRPPASIPTLEERLRSRFEGGMIADISFPDYETRLAIIKTKMQSQKTAIDEDILEYVAEKVQKNIRELEGVLNKVLFCKQYKNEQITRRRVDEIISETARVSSKNINANDILKTVSDFFNISPEELANRSRKREVVEPRQICMYLMRDILNLSYPAIGERLGKRDHTTAIHACEKITREMNERSALGQKIGLIKEKLRKE